MKATVLKSFYDTATSRTYPKGASYEASEGNSEKLISEGYLAIVKTTKKKVSISKEE